MNRRLIEIVVVAAVTFAAVLSLPGCGTLTNKGPVPDNSAPVCSLVNTPTDEAVFTRNEPIYWYAVDRDGVIVKYKYSVVKWSDLPIDPTTGAPSVQIYIDSSRLAGFDYRGWDYTIIEDDPRTSTKSATNEKIRLFAAEGCDTCRLEQVFFVVALDDLGAWSNVPYRVFFRTNHPPNTKLVPDNDVGRRVRFGPHFAGTSIEGLTDIGSGIRMSWEGSDIIDYPSRQPDFEYEWKVYGPFDEIVGFNEDAVLDTGVDYSQYTKDEDIVKSSWDEASQSAWTSRISTSLFDLFQNVESSDSTVTKYFVFSVRTRDDAYVPDSTPANAVFKAIQPACERQILIIDDAAYYMGSYGALAGECGTCWDYGADLLTERYAPYFDSIFREAAGYDVDYYHRMYGTEQYYAPAADEICKYKLVVYYSEDVAYGLSNSWLIRFSQFMDIGGKVMLFGPEHFAKLSAMGEPPDWLNAGYIGSFYFNIQDQYCSNWSVAFLDGHPNEEFAGAVGLTADLPESLRVDWDGHLTEYVISRNHNIWKGEDPYPYVGVPGVNNYTSFGQAEGLYRITSAYGEFGSQNGGLCGFRYETGLIGIPWFKSAAFGFQLYSLKDEDAIALLRGMIDWFDID